VENNNIFKKVITIFAILILASCARFQPIKNISNHKIPNNLTMLQITKVIKTQCEGRRWLVRVKSPGVIVANFTKENNISATIQINYSKKDYSIKYLRSINLKNDQGEIHRNYNKWVILLDRDIQNSLNLLSEQNKIDNS
jgi:hypothetical protein